MILYIDETENEELFIVTGLLLNSREDAERVYKSFKKKAKNMPVAKRDKQIVFTEFKSVILDKHYQRMKKQMLISLSEADGCIIYSCYIKKEKSFPQKLKEDTYVLLLSKIVSKIKDNISIVFDSFNKQDFERRIVNDLLTFINVQAVMPRDSQIEAGLQLVDNICSVIRQQISGTDVNDFYPIIQDWVIEA